MSKFTRKIERINTIEKNKFIRKRVKQLRTKQEIERIEKIIKKELHPNIFKRLWKWLFNNGRKSK